MTTAARSSGVTSGVTIARVAVSSLPLIAAIVFSMAVDKIDASVALSFIILGLALSAQFFFAIRKGRSASPANAAVFVFGLMFLFVAPIVQISVLGFRLVNTTHARPDLIIATNLACSLFIGVYLLVGHFISSPAPEPSRPPPTLRSSSSSSPSLFIYSAVLALCMFVALVSVPFLGVSGDELSATPLVLALRKFVFFIPTAMFLTLTVEYSRPDVKRSFGHFVLLAGILMCVFTTENAATEKRNGLGPVYLAVLFVIFRGLLQRRSVQVFSLIFVLLIIFPFSSLVTHSSIRYITEDSFSWSVISDHFLATHYDGWANIYSSIEMVGRNGVSYGKQLLGAALFFVPSTFWHEKPLATGIEIGNYLMTFHSMWFTNLSAPLIAEGYLDLGYFGVALYGAVTATVVRALESLSAAHRSASDQAMAVYFAFFLIFLLRGSLMIAFAFGGGGLVAFFFCRLLLGSLAALRAGVARTRPGLQALLVGAAAGSAAKPR